LTALCDLKIKGSGERSLRWGLALTVALNGLLVIWILGKPVGGRAFLDIDYIMQTLGGLLAGAFCLLSWRGGRHWPAALCGLSLLSYAVGQIALTYAQITHTKLPHSPSLVDILDLLSYPLLLAGLLGLPGRRLSPAVRLRVTLDGLIVMAAAVTFSWRLVLGPLCLEPHVPLATKIVNICYPLADLLLLPFVALVAMRPGTRKASLLLSLGLLIVVGTDSAETYRVLHGGYASGTLLDTGWSLGYMLAGLAVALLCREKTGQIHKTNADAPPLWLSLLPYALLPAVGLLVLGTRRLPGPSVLDHGVWLGALVVVGLVVARQVLAIFESRQFSLSLQSANDDLVAGEARYREMFEANPQPMWVYAVKTLKILAVNEAAVQSYGYAPKEFLALTLEDLHPEDDSALLRAGLASLNTATFRRSERVGRHVLKDGSIREVEVTSNALQFGGVPARIVLVQDITERRRLEEERTGHLARTEGLLSEAVERADRDPLTGLWNHRAFHRRLEEECDRTQREGGLVVVVMADLDNFKFFNDAYGHAAGDDVLRLVADSLGGICRSYDTLARFGGDEFALLLPVPPMDTVGFADAHAVLEAIQSRLAAGVAEVSFLPPGHDCSLPLEVSFGAAVFPLEAAARADVVPLADERLYRAKGGGPEDDEAERLRRHLLASTDGYAMLDALLAAVDNKDRYTRRHSEDVLAYSLQIADALGLDGVARQTVAVAALLHDVGKIGVPDRILRKPGGLTEEEFHAVKQHPMMGAVIVGAVPGFEETLDAIRHHHERWDGEGYPFGLHGTKTPLSARLMAVADAFSAMTTDRPYRKGMEECRALSILEDGAGTQWDPACVEAFLGARRGTYPEAGRVKAVDK